MIASPAIDGGLKSRPLSWPQREFCSRCGHRKGISRAEPWLVGGDGNCARGLRASVILHAGICGKRPKRARKNKRGRKGHCKPSRHDCSPIIWQTNSRRPVADALHIGACCFSRFAGLAAVDLLLRYSSYPLGQHRRRTVLGMVAIQAEKSRPDRNAYGSAMLATRAVASAGPTPGISSSRLLVSLDRCQAMIRRSSANIWAFSASNWVPRAVTHARAILGSRVSFASATTSSNCSIPLRPTGATIPNSARCARIELMMQSADGRRDAACDEASTALLLGRLGPARTACLGW
jgi:hypothetical protein